MKTLNKNARTKLLYKPRWLVGPRSHGYGAFCIGDLYRKDRADAELIDWEAVREYPFR